MAVFEAEAQPKHFALPVREVVEHLVELFAEYLACSRLFRARQVFVFEEVAELAVLFLSR